MSSFMSKKYNRLFVGNVVPADNQDQLKQKFAEIGQLQSWVYYPNDDFVYLEYQQSTDADEAIKHYNQVSFNDRTLLVEFSSKSTNRSIEKKQLDRKMFLKKGLCFNCKEKGHMWQDCQVKKTDPKRKQDVQMQLIEEEYQFLQEQDELLDLSSYSRSKSRDSAKEKKVKKSAKKIKKSKKKNKK